jgi:hypothetical protein
MVLQNGMKFLTLTLTEVSLVSLNFSAVHGDTDILLTRQLSHLLEQINTDTTGSTGTEPDIWQG